MTSREDLQYPDLEAYRDASFQHAESHYAAGTDSEECEDDDRPHWPSWWREQG